MDIKISGHDFEYDITSMSMLFFPGEKVNYVNRSKNTNHIISSLKNVDDKLVSKTTFYFNNKVFTSQKTASVDCGQKNLVKQTFYKACSKATGIESPWGILTGIRPLSVFAKHSLEGDNAAEIMASEYYLKPSKIEILESIYNIQNQIMSDPKDISIYISIPFCPSKCSYCSFISVAATNTSTLLDEYLLKLEEEIKIKSKIISDFGFKVKSLYIGGGTPGILSCKQITKLLDICDSCFDIKSIDETCIEIGRPELISNEKLSLLKKFNFNRICINTQTTNDVVLDKINRKHTYLQYTDSVELAKKYEFDSINTDLIAGLPGEDYSSFCKSVNDVIDNGVNNITIHTLAIKKSAKLSEDKSNYNANNSSVSDMLEYAYGALVKNGFVPYYIYRQKNCVSNGENIGFCKPDAVCKYNVYMMEDVHTVISCGAGASTKIINGKKTDRIINVKYPMEYVREFDKILNNTQKITDILKENFK